MLNCILIGNYPPPFSGQSIAFKTLVDGFEEKNIKCKIINTIEDEAKRGIFPRVITYIKVLVCLFVNLTKTQYKIVYHIISSSKSGFLRDFLIINLASIFGKKIILHSHNGNYDLFYKSQSKFLQTLIKSTLNQADIIILLSQKLTHTFSFMSDPSKFRFVNNGLPFELEENIKANENSIINVLYLSNLLEAKGFLDVLQASKLLKETNARNKYHFHFAGAFMLNPSQDKSYKTIKEAVALFEGFIEENKLQESVSYHGVVNGKNKTELLEKTNVFILPTYYNIEAQPITIIEAMAHHSAIFATDYRAISEMIIPGENGIFISPENPKDIVDKLEKHTLKELMQMGNNSYSIYKKYFTKKRHLEQMLNVFKELAND